MLRLIGTLGLLAVLAFYGLVVIFCIRRFRDSIRKRLS